MIWKNGYVKMDVILSSWFGNDIDKKFRINILLGKIGKTEKKRKENHANKVTKYRKTKNKMGFVSKMINFFNTVISKHAVSQTATQNSKRLTVLLPILCMFTYYWIGLLAISI